MATLPQLSNNVLEGDWQVVLNRTDSNALNAFWWIYNTKTGQYRKIGKAAMRGKNNYERAFEVAARLNGK